MNVDRGSRRILTLLLPIFLPVLATACGLAVVDRGVRGSGARISETRAVESFDRVDVSGDFEVRITGGTATGLRLEGDDNLLPLLETRVVGSTLQVRSERRLRPKRRILIEIGAPSLAGVESSGSSDVRVTGVRSPVFDADVSGSGSLHTEGSFGRLSTTVSGSGSVTGEGTAETIDVDVSGSGDVNLLAVRARAAEVDGSGSGDVAVHVTERLVVSMSGSGDVRYAGNPTVDASTSGSASVRGI
ncbi:MAG: head GIN domain-containing protein [Gemmatimonadota bacterium]